MNKLVLLLALFVLGCAGQAEARPRPRYVRAKISGRPHVHRPNYTPYRGAGNPFRGVLALLR
ncbi:hypothetical protein GCM10027048_39360 [Hymenobacter coalescens]